MKWKFVKGYKILINEIIKVNFGFLEDVKFKVIKIKRVIERIFLIFFKIEMMIKVEYWCYGSDFK